MVRAFNEERHVGRLLEGILRQNVTAPEIVVVDSGSSDATLDVVAGYPVQVVHIAPEEFTFGRSLNRGIAATTSDLVVAASAHVYPEYDDWLERLLDPFADPTVALTYGRQRGDHRTRFSEHQVFRQWFPDHPVEQQAHPFCNNANAAIRRRLWEEHPFDETLTGLEDVAWARHAQQRGLRVVYVPEATVIHVHEETPARIYRRYQREAMALRRIDPDVRVGFRDFLRLFASNCALDMSVARGQRRLLRELPGILTFRFLQFWGTYRGFARRGPASTALARVFYYPADPAPTTSAPRPHATRIAYGPDEPDRR